MSYLSLHIIEPQESKRVCWSHSDHSWSLGSFCYLKVVGWGYPAYIKKKKKKIVAAASISQQGTSCGSLGGTHLLPGCSDGLTLLATFPPEQEHFEDVSREIYNEVFLEKNK